MSDTLIIIANFIRIVIASVLTKFLLLHIRVKTNETCYNLILTTIESAVTAAEQLYKEPKQGSLKKTFVVDYVTNWLEENGLDISDEEISNLIESYVYDLKTN